MSYVMLGQSPDSTEEPDVRVIDGRTVTVVKVPESEAPVLDVKKPSKGSAFPWLLLLAASTYLW